MMDRAVKAGWRSRSGRWAAALLCAIAAAPLPAQFILDEVPEQARGLDIIERLGEKVPLDTPLVNSEGAQVKLGDYFNQDKPVVLALAYYDCPVACPAVLGAMMRSFNGLDYTVGEDFNVVVVSFDPKDTTLMAAKAKATALPGYERGKTAKVSAGWGFHTATTAASGAVAEAVGFPYRYLPEADEYSHPIGVFVLTPDGRVSKYFYGFEYEPKEMKLALIGAAEGKMSLTLGDRLMLFCYHYDPKTGTLSLAAFRLMQAGAIVTFVLLASLVGLLRGLESRRNRSFRAARPAGMSLPMNATAAVLGPSVATQR